MYREYITKGSKFGLSNKLKQLVSYFPYIYGTARWCSHALYSHLKLHASCAHNHEHTFFANLQANKNPLCGTNEGTVQTSASLGIQHTYTYVDNI